MFPVTRRIRTYPIILYHILYVLLVVAYVLLGFAVHPVTKNLPDWLDVVLLIAGFMLAVSLPVLLLNVFLCEVADISLTPNRIIITWIKPLWPARRRNMQIGPGQIEAYDYYYNGRRRNFNDDELKLVLKNGQVLRFNWGDRRK